MSLVFNWITFGVAVGLTVALSVGLNHYQRHQEGRFAAQALRFLQKRDYSGANRAARVALQMNPTNQLANQVLADLADVTDSPFALWWRERTLHGAPTTENRLRLAATALRCEHDPFPTAQNALRGIDAQGRATADYHRVAADLALALNQLDDAKQHYQEALKLAPGNVHYEMSLAVVGLQSRDLQTVSDSRRVLERLTTNTQVALMALRSLAAESVRQGDFGRARQLSQRVLKDTNSAFHDRIFHLTVLDRLKSDELGSSLQDLTASTAGHPGDMVQLLAWMSQHGRATEALAWLEALPREVRSHHLILRATADCYAVAKDWERLERFLLNSEWGNFEFMRAALLSRALKNLQKSAESEAAWKSAVQKAAARIEWMSMLVQTAESWGWLPEAESLLLSVSRQFPEEDWPLHKLYRIYVREGNARGLRTVYATFLNQHPADALTKNNLALVSMLLKSDLALAHQLARDASQARPANPDFLATYAYSLHLQGRTREAVAVLQKLPPNDLKVPSVAVYYGLLLAADGEQEKAREFLAQADQVWLLPEEKHLVAEATKSL
ncbi:MAG: hypothetical protein HZA90_20680 [Verrucomicrobia bacterium]|nr:hypothetical protein [Verrucomicrobiota bacterium]